MTSCSAKSIEVGSEDVVKEREAVRVFPNFHEFGEHHVCRSMKGGIFGKSRAEVFETFKDLKSPEWEVGLPLKPELDRQEHVESPVGVCGNSALFVLVEHMLHEEEEYLHDLPSFDDAKEGNLSSVGSAFGGIVDRECVVEDMGVVEIPHI